MWKAELRQQAALQHGVLALHEIRGVAATRRQIRSEFEGPSWEIVHRGVVRLVGTVDSSHQRAMLGLKAAGPGAVLSHNSAGWLWGLPGFEVEPVHACRLRGTNGSTPGSVIVHRVRGMPGNQVTELDGLPVVRPELLILQLAGTFRSEQVGRLLDNLWSRRLLSGRSVDAMLRTLSKQGRPGLRLVRQLLDDRGPSWVPPASGLEGRVMELLDKNGLRGFRRQVDSGGDTWVGRVDFRHAFAPLILEVQSERFHAALSDRRTDEGRIRALREAGFDVLEIWEPDVWHHPERWLPAVQAALTRSGTGK